MTLIFNQSSPAFEKGTDVPKNKALDSILISSETTNNQTEREVTPQSPNKAARDKLLKKSEQLAQDFSARQKLLESWLRKHADDSELRFQLAQILAWQGKFRESFQNYEILKKEFPTDVDFMLGQTQTFIWNHEPKKALLLIQEAKKLKPLYSEIYHLQVQAEAQLHDPQLEATIQLSKALFPNEEWTLPSPTSALQETNKTTVNSPDISPLQLDAGYSATSMNNGFKPWNGQYVSLSKPLKERVGIYTRIDRTRMFSFQDFQVSSGAYFPVSRKFNASLETSFSPTNAILPKWSLSSSLSRQLRWGFQARAGFRHSEYRSFITDTGIYSLENYWKRFHITYAVYSTYLHQAGWVNSHVAQVEYFYGKRNNTISLTGTVGRQLRNLGFGEIVSSDVHAIYLNGLQWIYPRFGLLYTISLLNQSNLYTQKSLELGVRYLF